MEHAQAKLPKYATNIIYQSNIDKSNNESLESNESSLEENESDEIKSKEDLGLDLSLLGKPQDQEHLLSPKAKKAKKKLKKILDAKNFVNEALKKEKGTLEERKAKISANKKDFKDQQNAKRISRANLKHVELDNLNNDTTYNIPYKYADQKPNENIDPDVIKDVHGENSQPKQEVKKTKEKKVKEVKRKIQKTNLNVVDNHNPNDTTSRDNINNTTTRTIIKTQSEFL